MRSPEPPIRRNDNQVDEATEDMKRPLTLRNAVFVLVILVLISAVPDSLKYAYQHGGFYLFSHRFLEDLPKRLKGPGRFRFILQPQPRYSSAYGPECPMRGPGDRPILWAFSSTLRAAERCSKRLSSSSPC